MPYEKFQAEHKEEVNVSWGNDGLQISTRPKLPTKVYTRPNVKSWALTDEQRKEAYEVIRQANEVTKKYGYWVGDVLERALAVSPPYNAEHQDLGLDYRYDLAIEMLNNTQHLKFAETLPRRNRILLNLDRKTTNKFIKALRRGARVVFGKDEW